jgi:hypothetical protein
VHVDSFVYPYLLYSNELTERKPEELTSFKSCKYDERICLVRRKKLNGYNALVKSLCIANEFCNQAVIMLRISVVLCQFGGVERNFPT